MMIQIVRVENGYRIEHKKGWDAPVADHYVSTSDQQLLQVVKKLCAEQYTERKFAVPNATQSTLHGTIVDLVQMQRWGHPAIPDDQYLLDAAGVMPIVESLASLAQTVDGLLNCAAEFAKDISCCSEYFQAADDKMAAVKKLVGYGTV